MSKLEIPIRYPARPTHSTLEFGEADMKGLDLKGLDIKKPPTGPKSPIKQPELRGNVAPNSIPAPKMAPAVPLQQMDLISKLKAVMQANPSEFAKIDPAQLESLYEHLQNSGAMNQDGSYNEPEPLPAVEAEPTGTEAPVAKDPTIFERENMKDNDKFLRVERNLLNDPVEAERRADEKVLIDSYAANQEQRELPNDNPNPEIRAKVADARKRFEQADKSIKAEVGNYPKTGKLGGEAAQARDVALSGFQQYDNAIRRMLQGFDNPDVNDFSGENTTDARNLMYLQGARPDMRTKLMAYPEKQLTESEVPEELYNKPLPEGYVQVPDDDETPGHEGMGLGQNQVSTTPNNPKDPHSESNYDIMNRMLVGTNNKDNTSMDTKTSSGVIPAVMNRDAMKQGTRLQDLSNPATNKLDGEPNTAFTRDAYNITDVNNPVFGQLAANPKKDITSDWSHIQRKQLDRGYTTPSEQRAAERDKFVNFNTNKPVSGAVKSVPVRDKSGNIISVRYELAKPDMIGKSEVIEMDEKDIKKDDAFCKTCDRIAEVLEKSAYADMVPDLMPLIEKAVKTKTPADIALAKSDEVLEKMDKLVQIISAQQEQIQILKSAVLAKEDIPAEAPAEAPTEEMKCSDKKDAKKIPQDKKDSKEIKEVIEEKPVKTEPKGKEVKKEDVASAFEAGKETGKMDAIKKEAYESGVTTAKPGATNEQMRVADNPFEKIMTPEFLEGKSFRAIERACREAQKKTH